MASDIESFKLKLGKRIKELRESKGLTQPELGALINKDYQAVGRIEAGRVNPSAFIIYQIAKALKVSANDILNF
jgi:transcriptional regulator with XRE-family HTH domain